MLDNESWLRLLDGLITATKFGKLEWEVLDRERQLNSAKRIMSSGPEGASRYFITQAEGASYELSSEDPRGRAPYELTVREISKSARLKHIGTLRSSVAVQEPSTMKMNQTLEQLFRVVDSSVEPASAVVSRLLRGLGLS